MKRSFNLDRSEQTADRPRLVLLALIDLKWLSAVTLQSPDTDSDALLAWKVLRSLPHHHPILPLLDPTYSATLVLVLQGVALKRFAVIVVITGPLTDTLATFLDQSASLGRKWLLVSRGSVLSSWFGQGPER